MTTTITFGDQAENHVGMQKLGDMADEGFSYEDLKNAKDIFENKGYVCELIKLHNLVTEKNMEYDKYVYAQIQKAYLLIIREGVKAFKIDEDDLNSELSELEWDTKAKMYGRVVDKHARYNLCFDEDGQEPDYPNGKGRIVAFDDVPLLKKLRRRLPKFFGPKATELVAEGNLYYDTSKCGIGYHGDSERRKVIALRLGESMQLCYRWYHRLVPVGKKLTITLNHGDVYAMSEKAVGTDWKSKTILTLRHAAGCKKYTKN